MERDKKDAGKFLPVMTIKNKNEKITIDNRDRERVNYEIKRQNGSNPRTFLM
jgi:hypothetical protein